MQSEKLKFARRHLYQLAAVGAAALLAKTVLPKPAKAVVKCTTASAVSPSNPLGLNPTGAGDPDCFNDGDLPLPSGNSNGSNGRCFLRGTQVITSNGTCLIEDILPGDPVLTLAGFKPVQEVLRFAAPLPPVCIARSALAAGRPDVDLYLSRGHAILVDGALVTAGSLVNGHSIRSAAEITAPEYLHLDADPEMICVHGVACESYVAGRAADLVLDASGARAQIASHLRSALSPWIEVRRPVDILRDRLAGL